MKECFEITALKIKIKIIIKKTLYKVITLKIITKQQYMYYNFKSIQDSTVLNSEKKPACNNCNDDNKCGFEKC